MKKSVKSTLVLVVICAVTAILLALTNAFTAPIKAKLDEMGVQYRLMGRIKSPYSIWKKMQNKQLMI